MAHDDDLQARIAEIERKRKALEKREVILQQRWDEIESNIVLVRSAPLRFIRNRRLIARSRSLLEANERLLREPL